MATHSAIFAWEIPWTEEPSGLQSMRLQRVEHDLGTKQQQIFTKIFIWTIPKIRISNPFFLKLRCICDSTYYCSIRLSGRSSNCWFIHNKTVLLFICSQSQRWQHHLNPVKILVYMGQDTVSEMAPASSLSEFSCASFLQSEFYNRELLFLFYFHSPSTRFSVKYW